MPTEEQLIGALRQADAAGDIQGATRFAELIKEQRALAPQAVQPAPAVPTVSARDRILGRFDQNKFAGAARSAGQGLTFGFADELVGGVGALAAKAGGNKAPISELYSDIRGSVSERNKQFQQENPLLSTASEIVGSIPTTAAMGFLAPVKGVWNVAKQGAKAGAVTGGLYGAGTTEGIKERVGKAAMGAGIGATLGAALPVGITLGADAINVAKTAVKNFKMLPKDKAQKLIAETAQSIGMTPEMVASKIDELGSAGTLADVDESFAQQLADATHRIGSVKQAAREQYATRQLAQHGDILDSFKSELGDIGGGNLRDSLKALGQKRAQEAAPLYQEAFNTPIPADLSKHKAFRNPKIQELLNAGEEMALNDVSRMTQDAVGNTIVRPLGAVERLHYAKKAAWDKAQELKRAGKNELARLVDGQRKEIDDVLNTVPQYKQARQIWSDSMESENAADVGAQFFKMRKDEFVDTLKGMNDQEKTMAKLSAFEEIQNKIGGTADTRSVSQLLKGDDNTRQKVRALFGSEDAFQSFVKKTSKWDVFNRTNRQIQGGSPTKERLQTGADVEGLLDVALAPKTTLIGQAKNLLASRSMTPEVYTELGNALMKKGMTKTEIENLMLKGMPKAERLRYVNALAVPQAVVTNRALR